MFEKCQACQQNDFDNCHCDRYCDWHPDAALVDQLQREARRLEALADEAHEAALSRTWDGREDHE